MALGYPKQILVPSSFANSRIGRGLPSAYMGKRGTLPNITMNFQEVAVHLLQTVHACVCW